MISQYIKPIEQQRLTSAVVKLR